MRGALWPEAGQEWGPEPTLEESRGLGTWMFGEPPRIQAQARVSFRLSGTTTRTITGSSFNPNCSNARQASAAASMVVLEGASWDPLVSLTESYPALNFSHPILCS